MSRMYNKARVLVCKMCIKLNLVIYKNEHLCIGQEERMMYLLYASRES